jgi:hypothetical protein
MVTMMKNWKAEFARALRNFRFERTRNGLYFPAQKAAFGGFFSTCGPDGVWVDHKNTVTLEWLDALYDTYFNAAAAPTGLYIAAFTNNTAPVKELTAATFAATQGEYTGNTEATRVPWVSNGVSSAQTVSNSNAPAVITIGAANATLRGAALLTASAKGAAAGKLVAAALFNVANTYNPGSTVKVQYTISGTPAP